jgi:hypothetical protein
MARGVVRRRLGPALLAGRGLGGVVRRPIAGGRYTARIVLLGT